MRLLNAEDTAGKGPPVLNLVYNPVGAFLPASQSPWKLISSGNFMQDYVIF